MKRKMTRAEVCSSCGLLVLDGADGNFYLHLGGSDFRLYLPQVMAVDRDDRPFRFCPTIDSRREPEILRTLGAYSGVQFVEVFGGKLREDGFLLTEPAQATELLLMVYYDVEVDKEQKSKFAIKNDAYWYHRHSFADDSDAAFLFCDYWIINRLPELEESLQEHQKNFDAAVGSADHDLGVYRFNDSRYRRQLCEDYFWRIERLGWSLKLYDIEASLLYIGADGEIYVDFIRYDATGLSELNDLLCFAEEFDAGGWVD